MPSDRELVTAALKTSSRCFGILRVVLTFYPRLFKASVIEIAQINGKPANVVLTAHVTVLSESLVRYPKADP